MKKFITIAVILGLLVILGFFAYQKFISSGTEGQNSQGQRDDIKEDSTTKDWKVFHDNKYAFELRYPEDFFDINQQPKLLAGSCNYEVFPDKCPNINNIVINDLAYGGGDLEIIKNNFKDPNYWDNPAGTKQTIHGVPYCLYSTGDAAAGHAFNYYYFVTVKSTKCLVVSLVTSTENCDNYLPLENGNTEQAKNYQNCVATNENQPKILDKIISTFKFSK